MFKARLSEPKLFANCFVAISNMIDEACLIASEEGLHLRAMDPAHVALVDFSMKKDFFDEFNVQGEIKMGLDLSRFCTILKRGGGSDSMFLKLSSESSALEIKFENSSTRTFRMPLIEVSEEELKVPSLDFPAMVEIEPKILEEAIKDAEIVSDHVVFSIDGENFYIAAGGELGEAEVKISKNEAISFSVSPPSGEEKVKSMFSIEYLKDMIKASDIASTVRIHLGNNIPVKLEFIASGVELSFLLAPRIESE